MRFWGLIFACFALCVSLDAQAQPKVERSNRMVRIEGRNFFVHTVKRRETLYSVAKAYEVSQDDIVKQNPHSRSGLAVGMTLLIPRAEAQPAKIDKKEETPQPLIPIKADCDTVSSFNNVIESFKESAVELGLTREIEPYNGIRVAMLLPFGGDKSNEANFVHFLQGALLAVNRLAEEGISVSLDVLSTQNSASVAQELINSSELERADMIIGPVYDEPFDVIAPWATARRVPIVSPLGGTGTQNNPYVIAAAPSENTKYNKLRPIISDPDANIIYIESNNRSDIDAQMETDLQSMLPLSVRRITYTGKNMNIGELTSVLDRDRRNVLILPLSNQNMVEEILSRYSSFNTSGRYSFSVIGTSRWARFANINQELFFKLGVSYVTSYHSDRRDERTANFTDQYVSAFGSLPTVYSMRGYDVMLYFSRLMSASGRRMLYDLPRFSASLLQVDYQFSQDSNSGRFENHNWVIVTFNPDYTITLK